VVTAVVHSKNGRYDAPQIVVGLAVTRDGFPLRHWIFPGKTVDVTTVACVKEDPKGCISRSTNPTAVSDCVTRCMVHGSKAA